MSEPPHKTISLKIPDMHCAGCARRIESALAPIAGVAAGAVLEDRR